MTHKMGSEMANSYNESFALKAESHIKITDPHYGNSERSIVKQKNLDSKILKEIINTDITYLINAFRVILVITILVVAYILRLTRQTHKKNKLIQALYKNQIECVNMVVSIQEEQIDEIDHLQKIVI